MAIHTLYNVAGTNGATWEINNVAKDWAASEAAANADVMPISVDVAVAATTDSVETCVNGRYLPEMVLTIGATPYSAGTAEFSIYNVSGSQVLFTAVDLTQFTANEIVHFAINVTNSSGFDGVFRTVLSDTPADGTMTVVLEQLPAPAA